MANRQDKINQLRQLLTGKIQVKDLRPVKFMEYTTRTSAPGLYEDQEGRRLTEAEMQQEVEQAKKYYSLVWHEVKTTE